MTENETTLSTEEWRPLFGVWASRGFPAELHVEGRTIRATDLLSNALDRPPVSPPVGEWIMPTETAEQIVTYLDQQPEWRTVRETLPMLDTLHEEGVGISYRMGVEALRPIFGVEIEREESRA